MQVKLERPDELLEFPWCDNSYGLYDIQDSVEHSLNRETLLTSLKSRTLRSNEY